MGAKRTEYTMVGRYKQGNTIIAYQLLNNSNGNKSRFSREQVVYLVGRGQVNNCSGQLNGDSVILRGNGINMEELPTVMVDANGRCKNNETVDRQNVESNGMKIVAEVRNGSARWGFLVQNNEGIRKPVQQQMVIKLAANNAISNAELANTNGKTILRGRGGTNLTALPVVQLSNC